MMNFLKTKKNRRKKDENLRSKFSFLPTNLGFTPTPILASLRRVISGIATGVKKIDKDNFFRFTFGKKMPVLVSGFTLIETMVAISIMLISIVSPMVIAKQGMVSARHARNSITAFYLAQDAVEYIRNVRDTNLINENSWDLYLEDCIDNPLYCKVDTLDDNFTTAFSSCPSNGCPEIKKEVDINNKFKFFSYQGTLPSGFVRNVKITTTSPEEFRVEVEVLWEDGSKRFFVTEDLYKLNDNS